MWKVLLVFLGGGLGSAGRYLAGLGLASVLPPTEQHPRWGSIHVAGTMAVNIVGCLMIGLVWGRLGSGLREEWRLLLVVGFLGGFTTYSAVGWETLNLAGRGHPGQAAAYVAATVALGLAAVWIGHTLGARWAG